MTTSPTRPKNGRIWLQAARPRTLPAAAAPVVVGTAYAYAHSAFDGLPAAAALVGALLIQIGTNFANDVGDFKRGADTHDRVGPARAAAMGWLRPRQLMLATAATFFAAVIVGAYLVWHAGWPILVIGLLSILSGLAYTLGPYPLGYHGWGDVFVFVFFGIVAVGGTFYVQAGHLPANVVAASIPIAALSTAILVVNNLRDRQSDAAAGKRTLAVRLGDFGARAEYVLLIAAAFAVPIMLVITATAPPTLLITLVALPVAVLVATEVWATRRPENLNPFLPRTAQLLMAFAVLQAIGVVAA